MGSLLLKSWSERFVSRRCRGRRSGLRNEAERDEKVSFSFPSPTNAAQTRERERIRDAPF